MSQTTNIEAEVQRMHGELGRKRLSPLWAKVEIVIGLLAASTGLLVGIRAVTGALADVIWPLAAASVALQTLGGYLALAGHRSHLYQSQNKLIAWLASRQVQMPER